MRRCGLLIAHAPHGKNPSLLDLSKPTTKDSTMSIGKPVVKLLGQDGNAFNILGLCSRAARKAKMPKEQLDSFMKEATAGSYDDLLQTAMKYFEVR